jgi:hypothetical protein
MNKAINNHKHGYQMAPSTGRFPEGYCDCLVLLFILTLMLPYRGYSGLSDIRAAALIYRETTFFLPEIDFEKSSTLIKALILVILYSIISMIILLGVILFHRNQMERENRVRQMLKEKYQLMLMDYLFNEDEHPGMPGKIATGYPPTSTTGKFLWMR